MRLNRVHQVLQLKTIFATLSERELRARNIRQTHLHILNRSLNAFPYPLRTFSVHSSTLFVDLERVLSVVYSRLVMGTGGGKLPLGISDLKDPRDLSVIHKRLE